MSLRQTFYHSIASLFKRQYFVLFPFRFSSWHIRSPADDPVVLLLLFHSQVRTRLADREGPRPKFFFTEDSLIESDGEGGVFSSTASISHVIKIASSSLKRKKFPQHIIALGKKKAFVRSSSEKPVKLLSKTFSMLCSHISRLRVQRNLNPKPKAPVQVFPLISSTPAPFPFLQTPLSSASPIPASVALSANFSNPSLSSHSLRLLFLLTQSFDLYLLSFNTNPFFNSGPFSLPMTSEGSNYLDISSCSSTKAVRSV